MTGKIHSFESFGAVDGPGIRFVIFLQGCVMRCAYCHNPDSWDFNKGKIYSVDECIDEILKYKNYFSSNGGVTVSGGEPLCQINFVIELFTKLKDLNIHTCLDTSGVIFDETNANLMQKFNKLMSVTDLVLLDLKHIDDNKHKLLTGQSNKHTLSFAKYLSDKGVPVWIRYVLVPDINSDEKTLIETKNFISQLTNIQKVEVLPYHTLGVHKYEELGIEYRLKDTPTPSIKQINLAKNILEIKREN